MTDRSFKPIVPTAAKSGVEALSSGTRDQLRILCVVERFGTLRPARDSRLGSFLRWPSVTALRKCPELMFVQARFDVYKGVSRQIHAIFADYTDLIQPLSLARKRIPRFSHHRDLAERLASITYDTVTLFRGLGRFDRYCAEKRR